MNRVGRTRELWTWQIFLIREWPFDNLGRQGRSISSVRGYSGTFSYSSELGVQRARTRSSTDLDRTSDRPKRLSKSLACMYHTGFPEIRKLHIKSDSPYCKERDVGDPTMSSHLKGCVAQYGYLRHKYRRKVGYSAFGLYRLHRHPLWYQPQLEIASLRWQCLEIQMTTLRNVCLEICIYQCRHHSGIFHVRVLRKV